MFPYLTKALKNLFSKPSTSVFFKPEDNGMPDYRGRIAYDPEKCTDCGMCIKVCSPGAITRVSEEVEGGEKITRSFDMTSCTFCAMCQDFCEEKAIHLTNDYHMVAEDPKDLVTTGVKIKEKVLGDLVCDTDNCIFCGLCMRNCPQEAITVDRKEKTWVVDHEKCVKCGKCISKCPKKVLSFKEVKEGVIFDDSKCVYCTLCAKKCPVGAITVDRASKSWSIDRDVCVTCGQCVKNCPKKALSMGPVD